MYHNNPFARKNWQGRDEEAIDVIRNSYRRSLIITLLSFCLFSFIFEILTDPITEAHFFGGKILNIGRYQVTFVPSPSLNPTAGSKSTTLNFSILENNTNINNTYSALTITRENNGQIIAQYPYKLYEFSDITIPFIFNETGDYKVTLQTRIIGDPKYQPEPLRANFDLTVVSPLQTILSNQYTLAVIIISAIVGVGAISWVYVWKKM